MTPSIRSLAAAAVLAAALAPAALAGGMSARVEGPAKDGRTYVVRTYACSNPASLRVTAWAEGIVAGRRRTLPLALEATRDKGVFRFERSWPADGQWVIRLDLGGRGAPVTLTTLAHDGRVRENTLVWGGNGSRECEALLAGNEPR